MDLLPLEVIQKSPELIQKNFRHFYSGGCKKGINILDKNIILQCFSCQ
jgi:hypothetical protein